MGLVVGMEIWELEILPHLPKGGLKKIIMEFSIKLPGWVLNDPVFR